MEMLEAYRAQCPYCGEVFETRLDLSAGTENYIEDCAVCCRPIEFMVRVSAQGQLESVALRRDDE